MEKLNMQPQLSNKGTHATYHSVGSFDRPNLSANDFTGMGYQWIITKNPLDLAKQPWILYAGAWGEIGRSTYGTGPLGPWYKKGKY